jgi:GNAT superfamily N-acetyltransferase
VTPAALHLRDAAADDDRQALLVLTLDAYAEYRPAMPPPVWRQYLQGIIDAVIDPHPAEQIVAERDGVLVGTVLLYPAGASLPRPGDPAHTLADPELRLLAVARAARHTGVATALVDECLRRARAAGAAAITLRTSDLMRSAVALYERLGFARTPELDFRPAPDVLVKGYRLRLDRPAT